MISNFPKTLKHEGVCSQKYTKNTKKHSKNHSLLGVLGPPSLTEAALYGQDIVLFFLIVEKHVVMVT